MAGRRMVYENMCDSIKFSKVSAEAERLWVRMLTKTDDNGNFHASPALVRGHCLPQFDVTLSEVQSWLSELEQIGLIVYYEVSGERYLHISGFEKYQKLRKDRQPTVKYPKMDGTPEPEMTADEDFAEEAVPERLVSPTIIAGKPVVNHRVPLVVGREVEVKRREEKSTEAVPGDRSVVSTSCTQVPLWKNIALPHKNKYFGKKAAARFESQYMDACAKYGEDVVVECFHAWAPGKVDWVRANNFDQPLALFFKKLPEEAEDSVSLLAAEKEEAAMATAAQRAADDKKKRDDAAQAASIARQTAEITNLMGSGKPADEGWGVLDLMAEEPDDLTEPDRAAGCSAEVPANRSGT